MNPESKDPRNPSPLPSKKRKRKIQKTVVTVTVDCSGRGQHDHVYPNLNRANSPRITHAPKLVSLTEVGKPEWGGELETRGEEGQGEGTRAHTRACIMCQSTKGGCTFSECNIIALEAGTRMPLNQSRSLGLGLQFHILSPSPPRSSFALSLSLLPSSSPSPPLSAPSSRYLDLFPLFRSCFVVPVLPPLYVLPISRYPSMSLSRSYTSFHPDRNYK